MPRRLVWLVLALAALLSACKVDATVDVTVRDDGSGVVRVIIEADAEAVKAAESGGVPLESAVRLSDLSDAGFRVGEWQRADDGSARIVVSKPFDSVDEVQGIVRSLGGESGPLPELRATLDKGLYATDYRVQGRIDLENVTSGVADDAELVARLQALGVDVDVIDQQLLAQVQSSFGMKVVVRLPGQEPVTFTANEGATTARVDASAQVLNVERIVFAGAALGFLLLALVVWRRGGRRRRRRSRRARGNSDEARVTRRGAAATAEPSPPAVPSARRGPPRGAPPRDGPPPRRPAGNGPPRPSGGRPPGPRPPHPPGRPGPPAGPPSGPGSPPRRPPPRP